jgi:hypothetical protein
MYVQNKKNARIFEFLIQNFKGVEVFEHNFNDDGRLVLFGKNGEGKSSIIEGIYLALNGFKGLPFKIDNPVGPYGKKAVVDMRVKADPEATELGEDLFIHFGISGAGNVSLTITDEKTGTKHTTEPREKIKKLLGMFLDPVDLKKTLDEPKGDKKLAEKLCKMVGLDLEPFVLKGTELFEQFQDENKELKRQEGQLASCDEPQEDWPIEYQDPNEITKQIQSLNDLRRGNEQRVWNIKKAEDELENAIDLEINLDMSLASGLKDLEEKRRVESLKSGELNQKNLDLETFKEQNKPEDWTGTPDLEKKIQELMAELKKKKEWETKEAAKLEAIRERSFEIEKESQELATIKDRAHDAANAQVKIQYELENQQKTILAMEEKTEQVYSENIMEPWTGEKVENVIDLSAFFQSQLASFTDSNKLFDARQAYDKAKDGVESTKTSIGNIQKQRNANDHQKSLAVAGVKDKFPHPGITVDENTVWVEFDDGKGKRTINDLSEGETLLICCHILIAGNTGLLNILLVRDGSSLDSDNRKIIYDVADKYGYDVVLETIETSEAGALHIVKGNVESRNEVAIGVDMAAKGTKSETVKTGIIW